MGIEQKGYTPPEELKGISPEEAGKRMSEEAAKARPLTPEELAKFYEENIEQGVEEKISAHTAVFLQRLAGKEPSQELLDKYNQELAELFRKEYLEFAKRY